MKDNLLIFDKDTRERLLNGVNAVAEAVGSTLGPRGRNVAINDKGLTPLVVHDGVTVARRVELKDAFENMGATLLKEAAIKTNDKAGDGTTTATILAQAIIKESLKNIEAGLNPMALKAGIEKAAVDVFSSLKELSKDIASDEEKKQIATISAASEEIGVMVAEALIKTGENGVVSVEEGSGLETTVDYKEGLEIDRGYLSPYFATNDAKEAILEDAYVLVTDIKINYQRQIMPLFEKLGLGKTLLVICGEAVEEGLSVMVLNKIKGAINLVAIQAPSFGERRVDELEDIAILTGGQAVLSETGRELESVEVEELGFAEKVISTSDTTKILGGGGSDKAIKERIKKIKKQVQASTTDYEKDVAEQRLARLAGGAAVINVGGTTDTEMRERKERVIDAVNATKAAIEEGVVAGGEIALYEITRQDFWEDYKGDFGAGILKEALKAPFKKLMENAGYDYAEVSAKLKGKSYPNGIDVIDGKVKNMIKAGIIDPVKVTRHALENAVSIATLIMTTHVLITYDEEK